MFLNFKLYFTYVFLNLNNYIFVDNLAQRVKNNNILLSNEALIYVCLHLKLSSPLNQTQLCEIFAYEVPKTVKKTSTLKRNKSLSKNNINNKSIVVYNFHSLSSQNRFFLFIHNHTQLFKSKYSSMNQTVESISELFFAAN
jgi:NADH:ubiquinone oxidoreductase subunit C